MVARARELGLEVVGELEIGWRLLPNEFCAVTGTNGKTTTTELIGAIHRAAGLPVAVAGNVGTPVSALRRASSARDATVVCEASSFQLEDSRAFAPGGGGVPELLRGPSRPPRDDRRATWTRSCACSPTRPRTTSRC